MILCLNKTCFIKPGLRPVSYLVYFACVRVLFRGKRSAVFGKRFTFLYTSLMNMCNTTFQVLRLSTFALTSVQNFFYHDYICG